MLRPYNGKILQEKVKIDLVDKLYSKEMLQGTEFYKKFKEAFKILDNIKTMIQVKKMHNIF